MPWRVPVVRVLARSLVRIPSEGVSGGLTGGAKSAMVGKIIGGVGESCSLRMRGARRPLLFFDVIPPFGSALKSSALAFPLSTREGEGAPL